MKRIVYSLMFVFAFGIVQMWAGNAVAAEDNAKVAGTWEMSSEGQNGTMTSTLTFEQDGGTIKGTITGRRGPSPLEGTIAGNKLTFKVTRKTQDGDTMVMEYTATVNGDAITGKVHSERFGDRDFTAKRSK